MKKEELKTRLEQEKVNPEAYAIFELTGAPSGEQYVLDYDKRSGRWLAYRYERGQKSSLETFTNEEAACGYFFKWVMKDESVKLKQ